MAEIEKTPTLGLNKPPKGYFDWDVPLNENWDKLDFLGAGQLPLLTPHEFEHRLEGNEAIGWAMQGSVLDGDEYTSVWEKLKTAKDRATQVTTEFNEVTYTYFKDATSGWVFLDQANYDKAFENLKDSLGFIMTDVDGKKTITLPKREVYFKASLTDANVFGAESLPNITGQFALSTNNTSGASMQGAFVQNGTSAQGSGGNTGQAAVCKLDASRISEAYQDGAKVNPDHHTVFIYYKVGNTIVNKEEIDVGNLLEQVNNKLDRDFGNAPSNIDAIVESYRNGSDWYEIYKSGKIKQGGIAASVAAGATVPLLKSMKTGYNIIGSTTAKAITTAGSFQIVSISEATESTFYCKTNNNSGSVEVGVNVHWFAIGEITE